MATRVLMLGWEFPPHHVGGLGVVSQELAHALTDSGISVTFVLPRKQPVDSSLRFIFADVPLGEVYGSGQGVYTTSRGLTRTGSGKMFADFIDQLYEYAAQVRVIAAHEDFDVIHAHDWLTYPAGLAARKESGKPLVVHVHNTIFDRGLGNASDIERRIEREGIEKADGVIAVSQYTKNKLVGKYGIDPNKIEVIHNAIGTMQPAECIDTLDAMRQRGVGIVLYHGRITLQKGVEYLVRAASRVLEHRTKTLFIISGSGDDARHRIIEEVARRGLSEHFVFVENAWGYDRDRLYRSVDVLVMPSVSEPFGIVPLEALAQDTPVIISKQSGVSEVLKGALKVDFWDTDEMANKILAVLEHRPLRRMLVRDGREDSSVLSWETVAARCKDYYQHVLEKSV